MAGLKKTILKAAGKSLLQTIPGFRDPKREDRERKYLVVQAHPDDEILIAGTLQRINKFTKDPTFVTLTDGNRNTDAIRLEELGESFRILGYSGNPVCLLSETEIYNRAADETEFQEPISQSNIDELSDILGNQISALEDILYETGADTVLVPDYAGGHFVHDITQMTAVMAARRIAKNRGVEVYEFPQYFIELNSGIKANRHQIREAIRAILPKDPYSPDASQEPSNPHLARHIMNEVKPGAGEDLSLYDSLGNIVTYACGEFSPQAIFKGLTDERIGMIDGTIKITFPEFLKKNKLRGVHKSQGRSLSRLLKHTTKLADMSEEHLRQVPLDRDYSQPPTPNIKLYELVTHRPPMQFKTQQEVYNALLQREGVLATN